MKKQMHKNGQVDRRVPALCLVAFTLTVALVRAVLPEGRSVDIQLDNGDVSLTLPGITEATYEIQVKSWPLKKKYKRRSHENNFFFNTVI